jgi:hypothetical protein
MARMNFGERVKAGLVSKIYGSKVCPKCGQLGYGIFKRKSPRNPKLKEIHFIHVYVDVNGVKKQTACFLGSKGKKTIIKGSKRVETWICKCGFKTHSKYELLIHVAEEHNIKVYEEQRKWIEQNCQHKVKWIKKKQES